MDPYHKITSDGPQNVQPVQSVPKTQPTPKIDTKKTPAGDRVEISERARLMQAALEQIQKMPDVDEKKVAQIKEQLEAGTYKPDSGTIAEKMLRESLLE